MVRAGVIYFACVFAVGFVLGTVRELALRPWAGEMGALLLEAPAILAASWVVCGAILRRWPLSAGGRVGMGLIAVGLVLGADLVVGLALRGMTMAEIVGRFGTIPGAVSLGLYAAFALFPVIQRVPK